MTGPFPPEQRGAACPFLRRRPSSGYELYQGARRNTNPAPRLPLAPSRGRVTEPDRWSGDPAGAAQRTARCRATMPPVRLRHATRRQPACPSQSASPAWSGQCWIESARYSYASGLLETSRATAGNARTR